jgi:hypothetical protein
VAMRKTQGYTGQDVKNAFLAQLLSPELESRIALRDFWNADRFLQKDEFDSRFVEIAKALNHEVTGESGVRTFGAALEPGGFL